MHSFKGRKSQQCGFLTRQVGPLTGNMRQKEELIKIGYVRVSKQEQNEELQIDALKEAGCDKWFVDKMTGSKAERKGLTEALAYLRPGVNFEISWEEFQNLHQGHKISKGFPETNALR